MAEEDLRHIFEPFYTTKMYGNGVGMFIVKQIVTENGGKIQAHSPGKGKGMEISLLVKKGDKNEKTTVNS